MSSVKTFVIQFGQFFTGQALSVLLGLITFPILTRALSKEQYGILGLVSTTMLLLVAISKAGVSNGIIRYHKSYSDDPERRTVFASTVFLRGIMLSGLVTVLYLLLFPFAIQLLKINRIFLSCFMVMAVGLFLRPLEIIMLNLMRVNEKTLSINIYNLGSRIVGIILSLVLLLYIFHDLIGYFVGQIITSMLCCVPLFIWFFSNYTVGLKKMSQPLLAELVKFGTPLLFTELAYLLLSYADRYMIVAMRGEDSLGMYTVGYNMAMYISDVITFSMSYSIVPIYVGIYETKGKEQTEAFLERSLYYLLIFVIPVCFGYYAVCKELLTCLASDKYIEASSFSPIILVGTLFLGLNSIFNAGLYLKKKTALILIIMVATVVLNIGLNIVLLPKYGVLGAAVATLVACVFSTFVTILFSYKYIFIALPLKLIYYFAVSLIMLIIVKQIQIDTVWIALLAKVGVGMALVVSVILIGEKELLLKIKRASRRSLGC